VTIEQAKDIVRQYFRVKTVANGKEFVLPSALDEARKLLSDEAITYIEEEVGKENG